MNKEINFTNFVRGFIIMDVANAICFPEDEDIHRDEDVIIPTIKSTYLCYGTVPEKLCKINLNRTTWGDCV